jgi:Ca-activated chloride channel family protein
MKRLALLSALCIAGCGGFLGNGDDSVPDSGKDPNIVVLEGAVGNDYVPAEQPGEVIARVRIGTNPVARGKRPAINLALVIDTSGSMEGDAIDHARTAALAIVDELERGDQLSVVVFHSVTEVLLPSTKLTSSNRDEVKASIARMKAHGTTDMAGGLTNAIQQAYAGRRDDGVNRIVLLSDGIPNDETQILQLAQNARNSGLAITALGLGLDYNETLLASVAQTSGGKFHYIDDSRKVAKVFRNEVLRLERVVARNATVTFVPGPGVTIDEVVGQQAQPLGVNRSMLVHLGDISEGDARELVLRLQATGGRPGATVELMDAVLRFQDTVADAGALERRVYLSVRSADDPQMIESAHNVDVERSLERARAAAAMVQAIAMARAGQIEQGQKLLEQAEAAARQSANRFEDDETLTGHADSMVELRGALPALAAQPPPAITPDEMRAAETAPSVIRESHDSAVRTLQGD